MTDPIVEFSDVSKTYRAAWPRGNSVEALGGVSFQIVPGEVFAILGPNRAGKTTLLKILLGLCRPTSGQVLRLGRPIGDRSTLAHVGFMRDNQAFPGYLTPQTLLEFYGQVTGLPRKVLNAAIPMWIDRVGLTDRSREPIARFSKGMVQRLALAQAMLGEPDLVVFDEPMEGLDLNARILLQEIVGEHRRAGKTAIIVSHALGEIAQTCDRLAVLVEGRLAHIGALGKLLRDPKTGRERSLENALTPLYSH